MAGPAWFRGPRTRPPYAVPATVVAALAGTGTASKSVPHGVAEVGIVLRFLQPIRTGGLAIGPAYGQVLGSLDRGIDDGLLLNFRSDCLEAVLLKKADKVTKSWLG